MSRLRKMHSFGSNNNKDSGSGSGSSSFICPPKIKLSRIFFPFTMLLILFWLGFVAHQYRDMIMADQSSSMQPKHATNDAPAPPSVSLSSSSTTTATTHPLLALPESFIDVLYRAREKMQHCQSLQGEAFKGFDKSTTVTFGKSNSPNETIAALPSFGIIDHIEQYTSTGVDSIIKSNGDWMCTKPNHKECRETQFSVVFMAYNPDRLQVTLDQIRKLLEQTDWKEYVFECILVWNGERAVNETDIGQTLINYSSQENSRLRVVYPLKMGLPNDLMNRYHPHVVQPQTKALLFYDDDGPFYSYEAVISGFELWKRHASAQVGAMAREISLGPRQQQEKQTIIPDPTKHNDRMFISHCDNLDDQVDYNFFYFANYDANMVLPSGSFLHSQYLCFLWHPVLEPVRKFVRDHPTHPDDMTVSMIVSQLAGRAPRVYSRRLNKRQQRREQENRRKRQRRLAEVVETAETYNDDELDIEENDAVAAAEEEELEKLLEEDPSDIGIVPAVAEQMRRKLLFSIEWDVNNNKMTDAKKLWAALRTEAVNALARYFGSLNAGSIGWCEGTKWYNPQKKDGKCDPVMARQGWLPWMEADGSPKTECP